MSLLLVLPRAAIGMTLSSNEINGCNSPLMFESFESGTLSTRWQSSLLSLGYPKLLDVRLTGMKGTQGYYYLGLKKDPNQVGDSYMVSDWIELGSDATHKNITVLMRIASAKPETLLGIGVQRAPLDNDWQDATVLLGDVQTSLEWAFVSKTISFPRPSNGNTSSKVRLVLRVPDDGQEVYYDSIKVYVSLVSSWSELLRGFGRSNSSSNDLVKDGIVNIFDYSTLIRSTSYKPSLVNASSKCSVLVGGAGEGWNVIGQNEGYQRLIENNSKIFTFENALKWSPLRPSIQEFNFSNVDPMIDWLVARKIAIHGHVLLWNQQNPSWLTEGNFSPAQLESIMNNHIDTVVGRYKGKIAVWDVVNEAFNDQGELWISYFWNRYLGPEFIAKAFIRAHAADPGATLLYNDYGIETVNQKSSAVLAFLTRLKQQGVPINGVGFQTHVYQNTFDFASLKQNIARFKNAGFEVYLTEVDVALPLDSPWSAYEQQATVYRNLLRACLEVDGCKGFQSWGYSDKLSWIPQFMPGSGEALPFDFDFQPKPAFCALKEELEQCVR